MQILIVILIYNYINDKFEIFNAGSPKTFEFAHYILLQRTLIFQKVKSTTQILSVDGTARPVLGIFAQAIRFLKDHLLKAIQLETGKYECVFYFRF